MPLQNKEKSAADILADETGEPVEKFKYTGEIPKLSELNFKSVDAE